MADVFSLPRAVVAGLSGGGGKTLVSLGLVRAWARRGINVKPCKKGPDYIDAAWLARAAGKTVINLDPFFLKPDRLRSLLAWAAEGCDVALIEGNRGLYDGRDCEGSCSTAVLARTLEAPVVLVLNCAKMTRTTAALVAGVASFEPVPLAGVILNRVGSTRHAASVRRAIETHTGIPVLGAVPRLAENPLPERHMGLVGLHDAELREQADRRLEQLADLVAACVDVEAVLEVARRAPDLPRPAPFWTAPEPGSRDRPLIGYVRDEALWFYYEENLQALRRAGADLHELSLFDSRPWPRLDGVYLGGGFPENRAAGISASPRLAELRRLSELGTPMYAECGGFMILCRSLRCGAEVYPMAGVFPARAVLLARPQGLGYVEARADRENPFHPRGVLWRGHEFHYSRCEPLAPIPSVLRLKTGTGMGLPERVEPQPDAAADAADLSGRDGLLIRNTFASYTHLFAPAVAHWAPRFVAACLAFRNAGQAGSS